MLEGESVGDYSDSTAERAEMWRRLQAPRPMFALFGECASGSQAVGKYQSVKVSFSVLLCYAMLSESTSNLR